MGKTEIKKGDTDCYKRYERTFSILFWESTFARDSLCCCTASSCSVRVRVRVRVWVRVRVKVRVRAWVSVRFRVRVRVRVRKLGILSRLKFYS